MLSLSIAASAAVLGGPSATASQGETPRFEEITVEAGSNRHLERSDADRTARKRSRDRARAVCRETGGKPEGVKSERIRVDRVTASHFYAVWSTTVTCEYEAASKDETEPPPS